MAFYSGSNGVLSINGAKAAKVRDWSISASQATLDTTALADTDRTVTSGIRSMSGGCTLFYYADAGGKNDASTLLRKMIKARTTGTEPGVAGASEAVELTLQVADGTTNGKVLKVEALLTSVNMAMSVGEVLSAQVNFDVNGAPLEVTL
jgi:hypothetical protein